MGGEAPGEGLVDVEYISDIVVLLALVEPLAVEQSSDIAERSIAALASLISALEGFRAKPGAGI